MNQKTLDQIKNKLEAEKARIENELGKFAHRNTKAADIDYDADYKDVGDGDDENASEVATYSDNLSLESELEKVLRDINSSLERIEKGEYGICKYCQTEISSKRLLARPTSSSCIACKKTLTQEV